ncbi:hypothetical protein R3P38DRAFT_3004113 [Favolaschia claudopus]|uniref:Secreted protein n=1 Tax=Favolaschia claudopus TaxID=2862362 RepID=A0AAW0AKX9_9AGAR
MRPSFVFTILAFSLAASAEMTSLASSEISHASAPALSLWQRWFALPSTEQTIAPNHDAARRRVRTHGPRRRTVHP